jgi:hypothetical protein
MEAVMTPSQKKVEAAKAEVKRLWTLMCELEGIPPTAQFVAFSFDNPHNAAYNAAFHILQEAIKAEKKNSARRARHSAYTDLGLKRVKGALGGTYYE